MLYHPDKGLVHRNEIDMYYRQGDQKQLNSYSHILTTARLSNNYETEEVDLDIDYEPEYFWDENYDDLGYSTTYTEKETTTDDGFENCEDCEKTFYNAVKIRMYGDLDMNFPPYYLEDYDEIELSDMGIEYLDGIKHCKHVRMLNLSGNSISDLTDLLGLKRIEELFLADNQISYIDVLSRLVNLRKLDISNNQIEDLSALFDLPGLQYLNVIGNQVAGHQIEKLKDLGVLVIS